jgi:hypothetical protein
MYTAEHDDPRDVGLCRDVLEILDRHYPGFPWGVESRGGMVIIRNALFGPSWGMASRFGDVAHDAKAREREIVMKAGEFLERGALKRGMWDGSEVTHFEGAKKPDSPLTGFR